MSNLVDNLAEGIHKIKYKHGDDIKKCKAHEIKLNCEWCLKYIKNQLGYRISFVG